MDSTESTSGRSCVTTRLTEDNTKHAPTQAFLRHTQLPHFTVLHTAECVSHSDAGAAASFAEGNDL